MISPMGALFSVSARVEDGVALITASGEFDLAATDEFTACVGPLLETAQHLVIDLRGVSFLDSSGLNALLILRREASTAGSDISLRSPSDRVMRLLEMAGVTDLLPVHR